MALGATIGVLLTLFAVVNSQKVEVHFLVATVHWPLILVIAISALLGAMAGALLAHRHRAKRRRS